MRAVCLVPQAIGCSGGELLLCELELELEACKEHAARATVRSTRCYGAASSPIAACCLAPGGRLLAYGCQDGGLALWSPASGMQLHAIKLHQAAISCCSFSADGALLAAADTSGLLSIWDVEQGVQLLQLSRWAEGVVPATKLCCSSTCYRCARLFHAAGQPALHLHSGRALGPRRCCS